MALVLVVEDEFLIRMHAVALAEEAGHTVIAAESADAAISILETRRDVEIVFSDVHMPGTMDGMKLLEVIRERWSPIRLVLTSGKIPRGEASLPGGSVFLAKPYGFDALSGALSQAAPA